MEDKIYQNTDADFKFDGHLLIEEENYYSLKTWKELNAFRLDESVQNNEETNNSESIMLNQKMNKNDIKKIKPLNSTNYPYILCFLEDELENHFENKILK